MSIRLLVCDDHEVIRTGLATLLAGTEIEIVAEATSYHHLEVASRFGLSYWQRLWRPFVPVPWAVVKYLRYGVSAVNALRKGIWDCRAPAADSPDDGEFQT